MNALLPVLILILWTFVIGLMTGLTRRNAVIKGETKLKDVALNNTAWQPNVLKWGNNFNNLFQVPVVFYALMIMAYVTKYTPAWILYMAWGFVALRILHSIIHVTKNNVNYRFLAFMAANLCNMAIAIALLVHVWQNS